MRTALYRFYSRSDRLLYVGITGDPSARFSAHRHTQPWWEEVATIRIERFPTRDEAARAEVVAIQTERPKYNRTHAITNTGTLRLRDKSLRGNHRVGSVTGSDANRFGTTQVEDIPEAPPRPLRVRANLPCPSCYAQALTREADRLESNDDWQCLSCGSTCTNDQMLSGGW